jgi:hypothetical protein
MLKQSADVTASRAKALKGMLIHELGWVAAIQSNRQTTEQRTEIVNNQQGISYRAMHYLASDAEKMHSTTLLVGTTLDMPSTIYRDGDRCVGYDSQQTRINECA